MRHTIAILLQNETGALSRVASMFSTRGYNIESLSVAPTQDPMISRLTLVTEGEDAVIEQIADCRAENGAEMSRLNMVNELLIQNQTNLEAAYGRIMDADVALESTRFARHNVLVQASAAMVAQANQLTNVALSVLGCSLPALAKCI